MSWMTKLMGLLVVVSLAACATQAPRSEQADAGVTKDGGNVAVEESKKVETAKNDSTGDDKPDRVCERVKRVGSHMTETYCYSRSQAERDRERAREQLRRETERTRAGDR